MAGAVHTGGKDSVTRKEDVEKASTTDDRRLHSTLERIGVVEIPPIEEVNIFKDDLLIQFQNPKVEVSLEANTWVVSGSPQTMKLADILPGIILQLGPDDLHNLRTLDQQFRRMRAQEDEDDEVSD